MNKPNDELLTDARGAEMKAIFREGWADTNVVAHRVERFVEGEFGFPPSRQAWRDALVNASFPKQDAQALDVGTGPGTIAMFWADLGFETVGVDFSPVMLAAAQETATRRGLTIRLLEADAESLPFADSSFDLVSSRALLFTLPHPGYALARWARLLRPGGLLVLIGENPPTDAEKLRRQYKPAKGWKPDARYLAALDELPFRNHTDCVLRVVMEAAGLRNIRNVPMKAVIKARQEHEATNPPYGVLQGTPYILVGQRV